MLSFRIRLYRLMTSIGFIRNKAVSCSLEAVINGVISRMAAI